AALRRNSDRGQNRVERTVLQRRKDAVETRIGKFGTHCQFARDGVPQVNLETGELTAFYVFERRVGGIRADAQRSALAYTLECGLGEGWKLKTREQEQSRDQPTPSMSHAIFHSSCPRLLRVPVLVSSLGSRPSLDLEGTA